jgi:hypothetical protein
MHLAQSRPQRQPRPARAVDRNKYVAPWRGAFQQVPRSGQVGTGAGHAVPRLKPWVAGSGTPITGGCLEAPLATLSVPFALPRLAAVIVCGAPGRFGRQEMRWGSLAALSLHPASGRFVSLFSSPLHRRPRLFDLTVPLLDSSKFHAFTHSRLYCCSATSHSFFPLTHPSVAQHC